MSALASPLAHFSNRGLHRTAEPVALKVQRRKYAMNAVDELEIRARIGNGDPASRFIMECADVFVHDHHICQVCELHGRDTHSILKSGPLPPADVKLLTTQVLQALRVMHAAGLVHSDIKPGNVLWCARAREARLIDFGNAAERLRTGSSIGTRDYCPPEMLLGNPMGAPVDLWALGCSVFEWLTGRSLFSPWDICCGKYQEFGDDDDGESSPDEDDIEEEREQLPRGTVLAGKYRLLEELGRGKCATVWKAEVLHAGPLPQRPPAREDAKAIAAEFRKSKPARSGYNIYEVVLGYEHFLQMQGLLGRYPAEFVQGARYQDIFYGPDGGLRFQPEIASISLRTLLAQNHGFASEAAAGIESFLLSLLRFDPAQRLTAVEALQSPWLADAG